jgi:benzoyl-CoA reductase/2-hydroxyglutaryl-CoA dehydratase subunit BcrC/BadD/HgdB
MSFEDLDFIKAADTLSNKYINAWKKEGKQIYGFYCSYIPEEILHSMEILPFRMRATGCNDTALADSILSHFNCSFVRCSLNLAMEGKYDFLDGAIFSNSCDHVRRLYDIWKRKVVKDKDFPLLFLSIPHILSEAGGEWLKEEFNLFKEQLESKLKKDLDLEKLKESIKIYNENRRLLKEIQKIRAMDDPKLNGHDFSKIIVSNTSTPKEVCNSELKKVIDILKDRESIKDYKARFMLVGSYVDNPGFYSIFEDVGGIIVSDMLCYGVRYFWDEVETTGNPLNDVVNRYYNKISCPRMMNMHKQRLEFIKEQVKEAKVDGVVLQRMEFCDLHGCDNMLLEHELEDLGIPVLSIDREYLLSDIARFKTRAEAFVEQIMVGLI